ncbi:MAG: thiol reductase thioredoxin [Deltaproteobacteria bacterium]|nr:thiol reductase thioredoxin [Deltaproteobacteria bacterium]NIS78470.1 thiol reductase thioredoxin [Deltaproteobacteria bacterium]
MIRGDHLIEINEADFHADVLSSETVVLVDFYTPPCAPCKALLPVLKRVAEKFPNVKIAKVNAWNNQDLCARYKIVGVPALLFFKNGEKVLRIDGFDASTEKRIEDGLNSIEEM